MANKNPLSRKLKADISPRMRGAFLGALEKLAKENGHEIEDELADWIRETEPAERDRWFRAMSAFKPREKVHKGQIDVRHSHRLELPELQDAARRFLTQLAPRPALDGNGAKGAGARRPVLLDHQDTGSD